MTKFMLLFLLLPIFFDSSAQQTQLQLKTTKKIILETADIALVLNVEENKDVNMVYLGNKLSKSDEYTQVTKQYKQAHDYTSMYQSAYAASGTRNLLEPAISVEHADGNQSLDLKYIDHKNDISTAGKQHVTIFMKDDLYPFYVELHYLANYQDNIFEQWTVIRHEEKKNVKLTKFASANLNLKSDDFYLRSYHGDWIAEMQPETERLTHGIKTLDSKLGTRTNLLMSSYFAIGMDKIWNETQGTVLLGGLDWSGNFRIDFEKDPQDNLRIIAGINNYASHYSLKPKTPFITPKFTYTLSTKGVGEGSRNFHRWAKNNRLVDGNGERLTLLNNWESTYFDFDEKKIFHLLENTKKLGVDLFLLDDGWFGNKYPRNADTSALGDWTENKKKLPNGIASITKEADKVGVKFGIWVEPEMISPKSELYEKKPNWVVKQTNRPEYYFRNQLVLDLSNPEVQDFVFNTLDQLLQKNPSLAYIKWDCNAVIYNAYSSFQSDQNNFYVDYTLGLYKILERFRAKYPKLPMMLCSGGGGRIDYGALNYFSEYWPSDNTDPYDRIFMQYENSLFFPAIGSANHVTTFGKQDLKFKIDVAMMGKMGFDLNLEELRPEELSFAQKAVKTYDNIKDIVWHGDLYRFSNPRENNYASLAYINSDKSKAVMFNYLTFYNHVFKTTKPIKWQGLDSNKSYRVQEINLNKDDKTIAEDLILSGDFLMNIGLNPVLENNRRSVVILLTATP
ncbi:MULTISPECIES: alpha-galactosidase [unclassified Sphingobacterium]|uniref:alpha-galactosidase n=1 Tax=unclassified Sphingobacterium TaxID=2609468 RepID=UPI0010540154|nr:MULTISPECIES: alpha-galactosidase [unclassified Sphingobacterium]MCS3557454.1 alpha-galactosidase [Sphingobacterium sp. JUb21]TCQ96341.1 alpha-galactosidase [Sphingobacterium sp. JUb20]